MKFSKPQNSYKLDQKITKIRENRDEKTLEKIYAENQKKHNIYSNENVIKISKKFPKIWERFFIFEYLR